MNNLKPVESLFFEVLEDLLDYKERHLRINRMYPISLKAKTEKEKAIYNIHCPKPSAFLYQKGATFVNREDRLAQAKDLYYMYFILRYVPELDILLKEVAQYKKQGCFINITKNIKEYFKRKTSQGCLMIEKENGPDIYRF